MPGPPPRRNWRGVFEAMAHLNNVALATLLGVSPQTVGHQRRRCRAPATTHPNSAAARARPGRPVLCERCHVAEPDPEGWFRREWLCRACLLLPSEPRRTDHE